MEAIGTSGLICGVDEAGRGPLAGSVVAAAVILDPSRPIDGVNDSKKLSEKARVRLAGEIREKALAWAVAEDLAGGKAETLRQLPLAVGHGPGRQVGAVQRGRCAGATSQKTTRGGSGSGCLSAASRRRSPGPLRPR